MSRVPIEWALQTVRVYCVVAAVTMSDSLADGNRHLCFFPRIDSERKREIFAGFEELRLRLVAF